MFVHKPRVLRNMELCRAFKCGTAVLFYVVYFLRTVMYVNGVEHYFNDPEKQTSVNGPKSDDFLFFYQGVEGTPGVDFPVYSHIPRTTFSCKGLESGYYADLDTECQVFHICEEEKKISFLCPNGTIFQQTDLICEWWFKVNCSTSPYLYEESAENLREDTARRKFNRKVKLNSQEKSSTQFKENSFLDKTDENKYNDQYFINKRNNHVAPNQNVYRHNSDQIKQLRETKPIAQTSTTLKPTTITRNNYETNSPKQPKPTNHARNRISHQKTRRFNENELGNYENSDYDKFIYSTTTTTFATPTENYFDNVRKTQRGYHVQFSQSSSEVKDVTPNQASGINQGPEYNKEEASTTDNYQLEFHSHVRNTHKSGDNRINNKSDTKNSVERKVTENFTSDETQTPQETASFVKTSFNSIHDSSSFNPFPNHRTTYSDLKTLPYISTKVYSTISSVTPQYITTQPINNGKPFLGSRVGLKIKSTKDSLFINPQVITSTTKIDKSLDADDVFRVHVVAAAEKNVTNSSLVTPKVIEKILFGKIKPIEESTMSLLRDATEKTTEQILATGLVSSITDSPIITAKSNSKEKTDIPKKLVKTTFLTTKPFLIRLEESLAPQPSTTRSTTTRSTTTRAPTTRFITKTTAATRTTTTTTRKPRTPDFAVVYGTYSSTTPSTISSIPSNSVQIKFNKTVDKVAVHLGKSFGSPSAKPVSVVKNIDLIKTEIIQSSTVKPRTVSSNGEILLQHSSNSLIQSLYDNDKIKNSNKFYVTKSQRVSSTTARSIDLDDNRIYNLTVRSTTQQPRGFQRFINEASTVPTIYDNTAKPHSYLDYKISTASPFKSISSSEPTQPTPFFSSTPTSIDENVDNMIDVLTAITKEKAMISGGPRPGLVVPPSVGPQTLHTLSVYFANALDEVIAKKVKESGKYPDKFMMENKDKLTTLLTQMTVHGYNQLFNQKQIKNVSLSDKPLSTDSKNETEKQDFKLENPQIRQLARNFTLALSAYLNDPDMFRRDLENLRPTEPPSDIDVETTTEFSGIDEELLNYSDDDTKTSYPPVFTTSQSPSPTWGFIIAAKSPNSIDVDNVIGSDLNTADTQSFVPGLNDINSNSNKKQVEILKELPDDHWTTSTSATDLWKSTFSIDPSLLNEEFDPSAPYPFLFDSSTETVETELTTVESLPAIGQSVEVNYELKSLPNFSINSSEVSGILIDFMNNSSDDSHNKLHRILRKLNTTENEFLLKMKEIEGNPVTRRLILLLISECGKNATEDIKKHKEGRADSLESLEEDTVVPSQINEEVSDQKQDSISSLLGGAERYSKKEDDQDTRALQLLNTLYSIASKLGK
ncbi:mucin-4-like isoform X1 [Diabrotica virgifera virgifera]|uniref:Chitin-binding type-2 domain-containing protein n=2 Tax=Diabrotica virgifera virgifera TaxID=50390 RepID=A0ABM5IZV1_DIAVI|nr:mucin-4-like isoform X1 [Diabrotica virgifera virgifera]